METQERPDAAILFPGMGPTAFTDVARFMLVNPVARRLVAVADEALGYSLVDRYRQAEGDYSPYAQIAFVVNCVALAQWSRERVESAPRYVVGPSFGGRAAAVYAGVLSLPDAVLMTSRLAACMDEYFTREHPDLVTHSFVRVPREQLTQLLGELDDRGVWHDVSCYVDEDFFMVTLSEKEVEWLTERVRAVGGMNLYTMKPPMHSQAFGALRDRVDEEIFDGLTFADPVLPVVADQDGRVATTGAAVREMLLDGFVRPVRWPAVVGSLVELGVGRLYVAGQDGMFSRVACTTRNFTVLPFTPRAGVQPVRRSMPAPAVR
ncbi:ACP S-malonyltransferase [Kitasatospora sp. NPDC057223]|uniref:ACP S-malonyltransferase n=1 Tax=Kitasatospora sp. NPDC057223 TaxID=3346055 RepID=UPI00363DC110